ncbi:putative metalloprotease CJM1_0395 family protein [Gimibacter soli]|uniref:Metalloprotease CJM1_0395 family protein n=1 Tax=Gimibacter soli TaxID=3024400 RepID=A0AAE9XT07_9PROT|nr:putative metalloprotease CJM1_0395 family protein [Gimibacter soli]WCL54550.1 putative metalloprotease CJM1_0395 family protein [Gimibacter soli]
MTTSVILPTTGAPPPGLRRPEVAAPASRSTAVPETPASGDGSARAQEGSSGAPISQSRASGVAVQVIESNFSDSRPAGTSTRLPNQLSEDEQAEVARLAARDREVRAHETAHQTAGAGYAGSPNFEYVRGPDGRQYAVGGHVQIDTSTVPGDPRATIAKMEVVRAAALAPARPSGQDRSVAAAAAATIREAEGQQREQQKAAAEAAAQEQAEKKEETKAIAESAEPKSDSEAGEIGAATETDPAPDAETPATDISPSPAVVSGPSVPTSAPVTPAAPAAPIFTPAIGGGGFPAPQAVNLINLFA